MFIEANVYKIFSKKRNCNKWEWSCHKRIRDPYFAIETGAFYHLPIETNFSFSFRSQNQNLRRFCSNGKNYYQELL